MRGERLLVVAVGLAAVGIQLPIFDRWLALLDEGYMLALADEVNRGKVLYRDVYVDAPLPGAFYLLAAWFRVAGTSVYASRLLVVAAFALFAVLVFRIGRELLPRGWALGLAAVLLCYRIWAFPHWHIFSYSSVAATALTAAVALVFAHLRRGRAPLLFMAGLLAGVAVLCKQDYGLGVSAALGMFLIWQAARARTLAPVLLFALGVAALVLPVLAYFAAQGALGNLITQALLVPLRGAQSSIYPGLPSLHPLFQQDAELRGKFGIYAPSILATLSWEEIGQSWLWRETAVWDVGLKALYYAPFVLCGLAVLVWGTGAVRRARRGATDAGDSRRLLLLAYAGGFLVAFNRPRDWAHLMMMYPPVLLLAATLLEQAVRAAPRFVRPVTLTVSSLAIVLLAAGSAVTAADLRRQLDWRLGTPRAGVYTDRHHGPVIEDVLTYVDRQVPPGEPVAAYPILPMLTFLAGRESPGGFYVIWPFQEAGRDDRIIADLERRQVRAIIYSLSPFVHSGTLATNAPRLYEYLVRHYEMDRVFSHELRGPLFCALRRRRPPLEPGISLLPLAADGARRELWPFAEVMVGAVGTASAPAVTRVRVTIPERKPRLEFSYGVNPERWVYLPAGPLGFGIAVEDPDEPRGVPVFGATLDPGRRLDDRRWVEASVDLGPYAGRTVTLAFSVTGPPESTAMESLAGWADPRLVAGD